MAPSQQRDGKKKRVNKRKSRTDVSSPSSSDSEPDTKNSTNQPPAATTDDSDLDEGAKLNDGPNAVQVPVERKAVQDPEKAFEDFYLRQATKEFANDLDKLRSAGDFNDRSVGMLVNALKQGTACFSKEERVKIGSAVASN